MIKLCAFSDEASSELKGQIAALKRNGICYTEIRGVNGKNISVLTNEETKETAKILSNEGIFVHAVGSPLGKTDISVKVQAFLDDTKRLCEKANLLGTDKIRAFSFYNAYDEKEKVVDYLCRATEVAASFGVRLCHENEKGVYGDTLERVRELLALVPNLSCVYDPANFLQVGENADDCLNELHKKAEYFHIKDVRVQTGEIVPAGYGDGKIERILREIDRDAVLSIEPHLAVFDGYAEIDGEELKNEFTFQNNDESFDFAVKSLKELLEKTGYQQVRGGYEKI